MSGWILVFDTPLLSHAARADRLDVFRDLLGEDECWTTVVVLEELRVGAASHPQIQRAIEQEWMSVARLDTLPALRVYSKWSRRIGSGERDVGEVSVLATAELQGGIAITDDNEARRVGPGHGVRTHGTIWLMCSFCRSGKLTEAAAGNLVDALRATAHRLPCTGSEFPSFARQHGLL